MKLNSYCTLIHVRYENFLQTRGIISTFHGCMVWVEKYVMRVTDRHHKACQVMTNCDPE